MAQMTERQRVWRRRVEQGLLVAAPALDVLLFVGDQVSRVVERDPRMHDAEPVESVPGERRSLTNGR